MSLIGLCMVVVGFCDVSSLMACAWRLACGMCAKSVPCLVLGSEFCRWLPNLCLGRCLALLPALPDQMWRVR